MSASGGCLHSSRHWYMAVTNWPSAGLHGLTEVRWVNLKVNILLPRSHDSLTHKLNASWGEQLWVICLHVSHRGLHQLLDVLDSHHLPRGPHLREGGQRNVREETTQGSTEADYTTVCSEQVIWLNRVFLEYWYLVISALGLLTKHESLQWNYQALDARVQENVWVLLSNSPVPVQWWNYFVLAEQNKWSNKQIIICLSLCNLMVLVELKQNHTWYHAFFMKPCTFWQ